MGEMSTVVTTLSGREIGKASQKFIWTQPPFNLMLFYLNKRIENERSEYITETFLNYILYIYKCIYTYIYVLMTIYIECIKNNIHIWLATILNIAWAKTQFFASFWLQSLLCWGDLYSSQNGISQIKVVRYV